MTTMTAGTVKASAVTVPAVTAPGAIEPLRSWPGGRYADDRVVVEPGGPGGVTASPRPDGRIGIRHQLRPSELDDELACVVAAALAPHTDEYEVFARAFTGVVLTVRPHAAAPRLLVGPGARPDHRRL